MSGAQWVAVWLALIGFLFGVWCITAMRTSERLVKWVTFAASLVFLTAAAVFSQFY